MKAWILFALMSLAVFGNLHCAEPVANFSFDSYPEGRLSAKNWKIHQPKSNNEASIYVIHNGILEVTSNPAKQLQGGYIEADVPVVRNGSVEFDLNVDHNESGVGLFIEFYNITLIWHDYCKDWRRYFPEATAKRIKYFDNEPVGHRRLGKVDRNKWLHYKVCFDTDNDLVEYYQDDMIDPVFIDSAAAILGRQEYLGGKFRIGCWGLTEKPMKFLIDNIVISKAIPDTVQNSFPRENYIIFNGLSFNRFNISGNLLRNGVSAKELRDYYIENTGPTLTPGNMFFTNKLPGALSIQKAKSCIFVDCPLGPNQVIPDFVLKNIIANIEKGMKLIVFGGLFTLEKGEFKGSVLESLLPVNLNSPWQVKGSSEPLTIEPESPQLKKLDWSGNPCVYYYHDLTLKNDANVLLRAGGKPLLVSRKFGKGEIFVFLGTACGPETEQPPAFWKWMHWPSLVAEIVK